MPLPDNKTPWPPRAITPALASMRTWDAWWSGDTAELTRAYGPGGISDGPTVRPAQFAGGVVGAAARMWWGRPPTPGEPNAKVHVPLASDICRASADLLFSEPITVYADDEATTDALDEFVGDDTMARFLEAAETSAGLGGVYLRVAHNKEHFPDAWIDAIAPDEALPEWIGGRLVAVTFWWVVAGDGERDERWRHVERHEKGRVLHGLYKGDSTNLGRAIPLNEHPSTEPLADLVDADGAIATGYAEGLDVVYIPNMRPMRRREWRKSPTLAPFGRPDLDGIEGILDQLDEVYSSWMRDIRLAKGRIIVPESFLETAGPGTGYRFDPEREVYSTLPGILASREGGQQITVQQFAIRVDEHDRTAQALVAVALRDAGYSAQTFGEADSAAITATEVVARERRSYITRSRKMQYIRPELAGLFVAWLAIRAHVFGFPELDPTGLKVSFPDAVSEDLATLAGTASALLTARAASIETRVRLVNPDWDDVKVKAEVAAILDEERGTLPVSIDDYRPDPDAYDDPDEDDADGAGSSTSGDDGDDPDAASSNGDTDPATRGGSRTRSRNGRATTT